MKEAIDNAELPALHLTDGPNPGLLRRWTGTAHGQENDGLHTAISRSSRGSAVALRTALASWRVWWRDALRLDTCFPRDWVLTCITGGASY